MEPILVYIVSHLGDPGALLSAVAVFECAWNGVSQATWSIFATATYAEA